MELEVKYHLFTNLSETILYEYIYPYIYQRQPQDLLNEITQKTIELQNESLKTLESIQTLLRKEKVFFINENQITSKQADFLHEYFIHTISPALSTIVLDNSNQFPHLKDRLAFLAIRMEIAQEHKQTLQYALIEIPETISRFVVLPSEDDSQQVMLIDDVIRFHLDSIFSIFNYQHIDAHMIKITRDAELDIDDDLSKSYVEKISESVKDRLDGDPVRFVNLLPDTLQKSDVSAMAAAAGRLTVRLKEFRQRACCCEAPAASALLAVGLGVQHNGVRCGLQQFAQLLHFASALLYWEALVNAQLAEHALCDD